MLRIRLPYPPACSPLSTVIRWTITTSVTVPLAKRRWSVKLACGHAISGLRFQPCIGDRLDCARCTKLRTPRAYKLIMRMAAMGLTRDEVTYLAGRLAEQRDRKDGER